MTGSQQLTAYLATLAALVIVFVAALIAARGGVTVSEAFGLGTITGGLIGILRIPSIGARPIGEPAGTPADPVNTREVIS